MTKVYEVQDSLARIFVAAREFGSKVFPNRLVECGIVPINGLHIVSVDLENQMQNVMTFNLTPELYDNPEEFFKKELELHLELEETKRKLDEDKERLEAKKTLVRLAKYLNVYKEGMEDDIQA